MKHNIKRSVNLYRVTAEDLAVKCAEDPDRAAQILRRIASDKMTAYDLYQLSNSTGISADDIRIINKKLDSE